MLAQCRFFRMVRCRVFRGVRNGRVDGLLVKNENNKWIYMLAKENGSIETWKGNCKPAERFVACATIYMVFLRRFRRGVYFKGGRWGAAGFL